MNMILQNMQSEYIGKLLGFELVSTNEQDTSLTNKLILDYGYCTLRDLKVSRRPEDWKEDEVLSILYQLIEAIQTLNSVNMVYFNLKLESVALNKKLQGIRLINFCIA